MKTLFLLAALTVLTAGCAHSKEASTSSLPVSSAAPAAIGASVTSAKTAPVLAPELKVPLPYMYSRRGVDIRVNSVEFTDQGMQVMVSLKETRGEKFSLVAANLMTIHPAPGQEYVFEGWSREGQKQDKVMIPVAPNEKFVIDVTFRPVSQQQGAPVQIVFPTGKWWSSQ